MLIHVVKQGETLWQISNAYHVSMADINDVNKLPDPNRLVIGQALVIPTEDVSYTVKPGDTLWSIAQRHGVPLQSIIAANRITVPDMLSPGTVLVIPGRQRPLIYVNGFIYILGEPAAPIVSENAEYLTYMSPFAYLIKEDGTLQPIPDGPAIQAAQAQRVVPMMAITNFTATARGENLASVVLNDPAIINRLLTEILRIMNENGYRGLNIDFENVLPADREAYNRFLQLTVDRLHSQGYFVSTSLAPKTGPEQAGLLYEAHDYPAHGRIADFVVLMTYEWGYRKGPPRAISPLNLIKRVLDYAVTVIPREKIFFGFQIYARDWVLPHVAGQEAETFSCQEAVSRAVRFGASIEYDPIAQSPFFRYTDQSGRGHEVWFEDARSAQAKFDTVKSYRLAGISYWALGYPFPQNWALLGDNFTIRKEG